jgi:hypothetical protein
MDLPTGSCQCTSYYFGGVADFLSGNTPDVHGGIIDKKIHFQVHKISKTGAMLRSVVLLTKPAMGFSIRITVFG